jgi:hypothetical protein
VIDCRESRVESRESRVKRCIGWKIGDGRMGRGLNSGTGKTIKKKGTRQVGESKQAMVLVSITPWRPCPQAIYFHRVITTSSPPYFLGPTIILSLRFSGFMASASAQAQSVMSMRYLPSFCLLRERFSMHLFNIFPYIHDLRYTLLERSHVSP